MGSLLLFALAALPAQGKALAEKVDFSCPPTRLEYLLPELSPKVGARLSTNAKTRNEVVVLRVRGVPASELMRRIAETTGAQWEKADEGYRLVRTPEGEREEARKEIAEVAASLQPKLAALAKALPPPMTQARAYDLTSQALALVRQPPARAETSLEIEEQGERTGNRWEAILRQTPAFRLLARLLEKVPAERIADVPAGDSVTFSTSPTWRQRALPPEAADLLDEFRVEHAALDRAMERLRETATAPSERSFLTALSPGVPAPSGVKILLRVERPEWGRWVFRAWVAGPSGTASPMAQHMVREDESGPSPFTAQEAKRPLTFSREAEGTLRALYHARRDPEPLSEPVRQTMARRLTDTIRRDPLAHMGPQGLESLGETLGENLIAVVPDRAIDSSVLISFGLFDPSMRRTVTVDDYRMFLRDARMRVSRSEGWLVVRPAEPSAARRERVDRALLRRFVAILGEDRTPTFDEMLSLAAAPGGENLDNLSAFVSILLSRARLPGLPWQGFHRLAIFASLSPAQRQAAVSEAGLPITALTPEQRDRVEERVYQGWVTVRPSSGQPGTELGPSALASDVFEQGLPGDARLRFRWDQMAKIVRPDPTGRAYGLDLYGLALDPPELGRLAFRREGAGKPALEAPSYALQEFVTLQGTLVSRAGSVDLGNAEVNSYNPHRLIPVDKMPSWIWAAVQQGYEQAKKAAGG